MIANPPFGSPNFRVVAKGLIELHRLIKQGLEESQEAEDIRDSLDAPLDAMSPTEKERAQWLSEDLYSISEPTADLPLALMEPRAQLDFLEAMESRHRGDWDRALAFLRRLNTHTTQSLLSHFRGVIWQAAGYPEVAAEFYRHATTLEPENTAHLVLLLHCLSLSDATEAAALAKGIVDHRLSNDPAVVVQAIGILLPRGKHASDAETMESSRTWIPLLEENLIRLMSKLTQVEAAEEMAYRQAYSMTAGTLAFCHELVDDIPAALNHYTLALEQSPDDADLLSARGRLLYGKDPQSVVDLGEAVNLNAKVVWPYLFLAHHYLAIGKFEHCRLMCEAGLNKRASDAIKSLLEVCRAIAQAELGFSPEAVRAAFEEAIRWDPSNKLARENREIYEAHLRKLGNSPAAIWHRWPESDLRQLSLKESRFAFHFAT
ncbi:MAG: hypothetical protein WD045_16275 [Pirellulaceae bacterium]